MTDSSRPTPTLADMLRGYSMEISARESKTVEAAADHLDPGTHVYMTWIPGDDPFNAVPAAATLRRRGLVPVPHIGARHVESEKQLSEFAARLHGEAGVDRVLIIAGDRDQPAGPYDSSLKVMESEALQRNGITHIGISGFPEGNPNIPEPVLAEALAAKVAYGRRTGLDLHIATQFCFEIEPVTAWLRSLRDQGIDIPIRVGFAGPASVTTLTRYAIRCGVGNSLRALTHGPSFSRLLTERNPEHLIRELATAIASEDNLHVQGLHFFVFGGLKKTAEWIKASRAS